MKKTKQTIFDGYPDQRFVGLMRIRTAVVIMDEVARIRGEDCPCAPPLEAVDRVMALVLKEVSDGKIGSQIEDFFKRVASLTRDITMEVQCDLN